MATVATRPGTFQKSEFFFFSKMAFYSLKNPQSMFSKSFGHLQRKSDKSVLPFLEWVA
jgi:hypothetical protein